MLAEPINMWMSCRFELKYLLPFSQLLPDDHMQRRIVCVATGTGEAVLHCATLCCAVFGCAVLCKAVS